MLMYTYFTWYDGSMLPMFFRSGLQEAASMLERHAVRQGRGISLMQ